MRYTRITKPESLSTKGYYVFINATKTVFCFGRYLGTTDFRGRYVFDDYAHDIGFILNPERYLVRILAEEGEKLPPVNDEFGFGTELSDFINQYNALRNL